jgi:transcriptional regulator
MYVPAHFRMEDRDELHALIAAHPLGMLVTSGDEGVEASHVPFVMHADEGANGVLRTHLARANPQWSRIAVGTEALVVFRAADGYVTPSWYPSKAQHGKVVPTWNYLAVHVSGPCRIVTESAWLDAHLAALSAQQEAGRDHPWAVTDAPASFIEQMKRAIVGVEIEVRAMVGKKKVGQNRPGADRHGLFAAWRAAGDPASRIMADRLAPYLSPPEPR